MSDPRGTILRALRALVTALRPLDAMLADANSASSLLADLGVNAPLVPPSLLQLRALVQQLSAALTTVEGLLAGQDEASPQVLAKIADLGVSAKNLFSSLHDLPPQLHADLAAYPDMLAEIDAGELAKRLSSRLLIEYLRGTRPEIFNSFMLLGLIEVHDVGAGSDYVPAHTRYAIRADRLRLWFTDPSAALADIYGWGTATFDHRMLLVRLQYLLLSLGYPSVLDRLGGEPVPDGDALPPGDVELHLPIFSELTGGATVGLDAVVRPTIPPNANDTGLLLTASATGQVATAIELTGGVLLTLGGDFEVTGGIGLEVKPPFRVQPVAGTAAGTQAAARFAAELALRPGGGSRIALLEQPGLLVLDVAGVATKVGVELHTGADPVLQIEARLLEGLLAIGVGEADGFLLKIFPPGGLQVPFELGVGWRSDHGVYLLGSGSFEVELPLSIDLFGILRINAIAVALQVGTDGIEGGLTCTAQASIGPVSAVVERVGTALLLRSKDTGGNLGPLDASIQFKPPNGIGVTINAGPVNGGGYISLDYEKGRYSGVLQLQVLSVAVKAIGLLDTKLPDGRPGYSFLLIITTEFSPIQLGYGFTLNGVGGLAGINRSINAEALRLGVYAGSLDHILFPRDPVRNAPQLISDLSLIFPPAEGQYSFGPMAKLGWGTPTLIEISLGIIIELPPPIRIALLGQIGMFLPKREAAIVEIHIDFVAMIDFGARLLSLDATLRDSRVLTFTLTGDMALRLCWGDQPNFAVALGGFHPHFPTPPGFPALRRLTLAIGAGDYIRITCQTYQALTTNSFQFGARAEVFVDVEVKVHGWIGFDTLFIFSPFSFQVDFTAGLEVSAAGISLAGVTVDGTLSGPTPWRIRGQATLSVLLVEVTARVDERFGQERREELPPVDPWDKLHEALIEVRNWAGTPLPGTTAVVSLAVPPDIATPLLDPGGRATWRQKVVPLNRTITRFGNAPTPAPVKYSIDRVTVATVSNSFVAVTDFFAPGQSNELTDAEKLSRPSFETMDAGIALGGDALDFGMSVPAEIYYETKLIDSEFESRRGSHFAFGKAAQLALVKGSAQARAGAVRSGMQAFGGASKLKQAGDQYVVVSTADLSKHSTLSTSTTKGAATEALEEYLRDKPAERGRWQVIPSHELEAA